MKPGTVIEIDMERAIILDKASYMNLLTDADVAKEAANNLRLQVRQLSSMLRLIVKLREELPGFICMSTTGHHAVAKEAFERAIAEAGMMLQEGGWLK